MLSVMKGIALIRQQIGHLDSVWFLMSDDIVMARSLVLPPSLPPPLCEHFSTVLALAYKLA